MDGIGEKKRWLQVELINFVVGGSANILICVYVTKEKKITLKMIDFLLNKI